MTDRLSELTAGQHLSRYKTTTDLEGGGGANVESDRLLDKFNKEISAIDRVIVWSNGVINQPPTVDTAQRTQDLNDVEVKLKSVRKRLKNMAGANKVFSNEHSHLPSTVHMRLVRYKKTSQDFITLTGKLSDTWESHRVVVSREMKRDIMSVNPRVSEREVDSAIRSGQQARLEDVLDVGDNNREAARHQLEDIRMRNMDLQNLMANVAELNQAFQEMSILVEQQQDLINNVEFNIEDSKKDAKKAGDELHIAHNHQKRNRKMKIACAIVVFIIIGIILAIILSKVLPNNSRV